MDDKLSEEYVTEEVFIQIKEEDLTEEHCLKEDLNEVDCLAIEEEDLSEEHSLREDLNIVDCLELKEEDSSEEHCLKEDLSKVECLEIKEEDLSEEHCLEEDLSKVQCLEIKIEDSSKEHGIEIKEESLEYDDANGYEFTPMLVPVSESDISATQRKRKRTRKHTKEQPSRREICDNEEARNLLGALSDDELSDMEEDWPTADIKPQEIFVDTLSSTETESEEESEVSDTDDTEQLTSSPGNFQPSSIGRSRRVPRTGINTFHRNNNFQKKFPRQVDSAETDPIILSPIEYFNAYVPDDIWYAMALETQKKCNAKKGCTDIDREVMKKFIGINFAMGVLKLPRVAMYWGGKTRIAMIADALSRDLFCAMKGSLTLVDEISIAPGKKKENKYWKVAPLIHSIRKRCKKLRRPEFVSVDVMTIPFKGRSNLVSFNYSKSITQGITVYVLVASNGLILDFEFFQGKESLISSVQQTGLDVSDLEDLTVGEAGVLRFVKSVSQGTSFYFDKYFTSTRLIQMMTSYGMGATGILKKNISPRNACHKTEKQLKRSGRGSSDCIVRDDLAFSVTVWYNKKPVFVASNEHGVYPLSHCQRWSKKEKKHVQMPRPRVIEAYNSHMGGVNITEQVMSYYRYKSRTRKFTVRLIFYLFDLICANAWLEYRHDCKLKKVSAMDSMAFKLKVAESLIDGNFTYNAGTDSGSDSESACSSRRRPRELPSAQARTRGASHMPKVLPPYSIRQRCRYPGCNSKTRISCDTCKIFLCLSAERNCYSLFHLP